MPLHLLKTAAGLQELDQLLDRQQGGLCRYNGVTATYTYTRYKPTRSDEILSSGGSIYWILKNSIQARQNILGFETVKETDGTSWCKIMVEPALIQTVAIARKAIQGWRYFEGKDVPKDHGGYVLGAMQDQPPADLALELKNLGLL